MAITDSEGKPLNYSDNEFEEQQAFLTNIRPASTVEAMRRGLERARAEGRLPPLAARNNPNEFYHHTTEGNEMKSPYPRAHFTPQSPMEGALPYPAAGPGMPSAPMPRPAFNLQRAGAPIAPPQVYAQFPHLQHTAAYQNAPYSQDIGEVILSVEMFFNDYLYELNRVDFALINKTDEDTLQARQIALLFFRALREYTISQRIVHANMVKVPHDPFFGCDIMPKLSVVIGGESLTKTIPFGMYARRALQSFPSFDPSCNWSDLLSQASEMVEVSADPGDQSPLGVNYAEHTLILPDVDKVPRLLHQAFSPRMADFNGGVSPQQQREEKDPNQQGPRNL